MHNNQKTKTSQQQNTEKFHSVNYFSDSKSCKTPTDPFNFLQVSFIELEISAATKIFVERHKLTAADAMLAAIIKNATKVVRDYQLYYHCTDNDLIKMSFGAFACRRTFIRARKKLIECGIITTTNKYNAKRVKGKLPNNRTWYCIDIIMLKKAGINQWDLFNYARSKSNKVRAAYKQAGILAKSESTLKRKKFETLKKIAQKKNVTTNCLKNKVYYNNDQRIKNFQIKKEIFSTKSAYSPYHRLRDFTQERLDREKGIEKPKPITVNFASNDCVKQVVNKLNCRYDKGYARLEEKTLDDDLDGALNKMLKLIKTNNEQPH